MDWAMSNPEKRRGPVRLVETPRLSFNALEPGFTPNTGLGREVNAFLRFLANYILPLLAPHIKYWSTPKRAARVAPGPVATDFSGGIVRDNPAVNKRIVDNTALGRAGVPDDLGPVIASLLSEETVGSMRNASRLREG